MRLNMCLNDSRIVCLRCVVWDSMKASKIAIADLQFCPSNWRHLKNTKQRKEQKNETISFSVGFHLKLKLVFRIYPERARATAKSIWIIWLTSHCSMDIAVVAYAIRNPFIVNHLLDMQMNERNVFCTIAIYNFAFWNSEVTYMQFNGRQLWAADNDRQHSSAYILLRKYPSICRVQRQEYLIKIIMSGAVRHQIIWTWYAMVRAWSTQIFGHSKCTAASKSLLVVCTLVPIFHRVIVSFFGIFVCCATRRGAMMTGVCT